MGKIIKAEKRGGGGIESKVIEEYTPLQCLSTSLMQVVETTSNKPANINLHQIKTDFQRLDACN